MGNKLEGWKSFDGKVERSFRGETFKLKSKQDAGM